MLKRIEQRAEQHRTELRWTAQQLRNYADRIDYALDRGTVPGTLELIARFRDMERHTHALRVLADVKGLVHDGEWPVTW